MTEQPVESLADLLSTATINRILQETPLTSADRCDRCGAQAYVLVHVQKTALHLTFCAHHWYPLQDDARFLPLRDERAALHAAPSPTIPAFP